MSDEAYVRSEFRKAEKWLNVMSMDPSKVSVDEVDGLREEIADLKAQGKRNEAAINEMLEARRRLG